MKVKGKLEQKWTGDGNGSVATLPLPDQQGWQQSHEQQAYRQSYRSPSNMLRHQRMDPQLSFEDNNSMSQESLPVQSGSNCGETLILSDALPERNTLDEIEMVTLTASDDLDSIRYIDSDNSDEHLSEALLAHKEDEEREVDSFQLSAGTPTGILLDRKQSQRLKSKQQSNNSQLGMEAHNSGNKVIANGSVPKARPEGIGLRPLGEPTKREKSASSPSSQTSLTRRVHFHASVLPNAETRALIQNGCARIIRVRDAAVSTRDGQVMDATPASPPPSPVRTPLPAPATGVTFPVVVVDNISEDTTETDDVDDEFARETWSGKMDFLVSCLGYAIGLGNVWRFPYLCYRNGGGAFFLPYFIFVVIVGIPLVFLEVAFGQFAGLGPISIWNVAPMFKGIGMAMVALSFIVCVYYNVILAWSLFYLFASMQSPLPWTTCNNTWNTAACCATRYYPVGDCFDANGTRLKNTTCHLICGDNLSKNVTTGNISDQDNDVLSVNLKYSSTFKPLQSNDRTSEDATNLSEHAWTPANVSNSSEWQSGDNQSEVLTKLASPSEEYFYRNVLEITSSLGNLGGVRWHLSLCLLLAWIVVFLCLIKGARSSGKVMYVTVIIPYLILLVLLIKALTLEGAKHGIIFYISPKWNRLADPQVWHDAINQVFFSLSPCFGGLLTLASYNKFHHNCYREALLVPVLNSLTSIFAGFPIFCTLGYMALQLGTDIENVVRSGSGLAFVVYPEALAQMPGSVAWAMLFFLMLLFLGIDSQLGYVQTIVMAIVDEYPALLYKKRLILLAGMCVLLYVCGLPLVTQGGIYMLEVLDTFVVTYPPVVIGILECVVLMWVYGYSHFARDVWYMFGKQPGRWWRFLWQFVTPALLTFLLVFNGTTYGLMDLSGPTSTEGSRVVGWLFIALCIAPIPIYALYAVVITPGQFLERLRANLKPAAGWGVFTDATNDATIPEYIHSEDEEGGLLPDPPPDGRPGTTDQLGGTMLTVDELDRRSRSGAGEVEEDDIDTGSVVWSEDENKERGNWHGRYDFLMSGLGYTVGLGNVWRFPYLVYKNGGGAFFLPYLLMLFLCGLPLFYMELAFGQFASVGSISVWRVSPLFKGIGYTTQIVVFLVATYYNVLTSWAVYYLCASMTASLPWASCNNTWNTPKCRIHSSEVGHLVANVTICNDSTIASSSQCANLNGTNSTSVIYNSASYEYFFNRVLNVSSGIEDLGTIQWPLALCLLAGSFFSFIALIRGVKSIGKIVYVTVAFPYIILLILLARYVTLGTGHLDGIKFYVTPQWHRLKDATVWGDAASQLFFSLGLSMGGLVSLASYNRFHYDCFRDAYMICLVDTLTSVFAGFVVFAILGVMAHEAGTDVQNVVTSKFALAYIVFPEAVTRLPVAPFWSVLFFLMLFSLAIDSQFLMTAAVLIAILDEFNATLGPHRFKVILVICIMMYLLGLPMATQGGVYIVLLMDRYVAAWCPLVVAILTCVVLTWVYGVKAFASNVHSMLGQRPSLYWQVLWKGVIPVILLLLLAFLWAKYEAPSVENYVYPNWAHGLGLAIATAPLLCIPVVACIQLLKTPGSCLKRFHRTIAPSDGWGPALKRHRPNVYLPQLPALEPTWSSNWLIMAKEMSIYATETSAFVSMAAYARPVPDRGSRKKSRDKTVSIISTGECSDKNIQTDGGMVEEDSVVVVAPRKLAMSRQVDATTQTSFSQNFEGDDEKELVNTLPVRRYRGSSPGQSTSRSLLSESGPENFDHFPTRGSELHGVYPQNVDTPGAASSPTQIDNVTSQRHEDWIGQCSPSGVSLEFYLDTSNQSNPDADTISVEGATSPGRENLPRDSVSNGEHQVAGPSQCFNSETSHPYDAARRKHKALLSASPTHAQNVPSVLVSDADRSVAHSDMTKRDSVDSEQTDTSDVDVMDTYL